MELDLDVTKADVAHAIKALRVLQRRILKTDSVAKEMFKQLTRKAQREGIPLVLVARVGCETRVFAKKSATETIEEFRRSGLQLSALSPASFFQKVVNESRKRRRLE